VKTWICLLSFLLTVDLAIGQPQADAVLEQAQEAALEGNCDLAVSRYEALLDSGYGSAGLYYNLGHCYFQKQQLGPAILMWERAHLLKPGDKAIRKNLQFAHSERVDDLVVLPPFFLTVWWQQLRGGISPVAWSIIGLVLLWGGAIGLAVFWLGKQRHIKKRGFIWGWTLLLIALLPLALAFSSRQAVIDSGYAIVLEKSISLRAAPDEQSQEIVVVHEGLKVRLLDQIGSWKKVQLTDGVMGWLPAAVMEEI
jgi:tetratricopeptide (TPR) repeat protein